MKAISASIIVFSGAIILAFGATIRQNDTQTFIALCGVVVEVIGLAGWIGILLGKWE